jgi:hypothetical protein
MAVTSTSIFQHANVEALMVTGSKPRFEILVDGEVKQVVPASRKWQAEQKAVVAAARELAGVTVEPVAAELPARLHEVSRSSFIKQLGYSLKRQELAVVFASGSTFIYRAVTLAEFNRLRCAHSVGCAFNTIVRGHKAGFAAVA